MRVGIISLTDQQRQLKHLTFIRLKAPYSHSNQEREAIADLPLPGDPVVVPVVPVPADQGELLPLPDVVGPEHRLVSLSKIQSCSNLSPDWILDFIL